MDGTDERRKHLARLMDDRRRQLRLKWSHVAQRAGMSAENLRVIRNGTINITVDAADRIEDALEWARGSIKDIVLHGTPPRSTPTTHSGLPPARESDVYPPGWTSEEEAEYQAMHPVLHPMLLTQGMEFTRQAWRYMREEFRRLRALEQFTQRAWSDEDSDQSTRSRDT